MEEEMIFVQLSQNIFLKQNYLEKLVKQLQWILYSAEWILPPLIMKLYYIAMVKWNKISSGFKGFI